MSRLPTRRWQSMRWTTALSPIGSLSSVWRPWCTVGVYSSAMREGPSGAIVAAAQGAHSAPTIIEPAAVILGRTGGPHDASGLARIPIRGGRRAGRRGPAGAGPGPGLHPGHGCRSAEPGSRGLAQLAAHARRVGLQPARSDRYRQRLRPAAGLVLGPRAGRVADDAARARRRHVPRQPRQRGAGPRRADRRLHLGAPPRDGRAAAARRADAQPGHLRGPDHPQHGRRAHRRPRRPHRRGALGYGRRARRRRLRLLERPGHRRRHHRGGAAGLRALPRGHLLHRRHRRPHRAHAVAHVDHRPPGRARRRHLGRPAAAVPRRQRRLDSRQLRPGQPPRLLRHRAGQALDARRARHGRGRASTATRRSRSIRPPARCAGTSSTSRATATTWTRRSSAS